jgi:hypothetical protein
MLVPAHLSPPAPLPTIPISNPIATESSCLPFYNHRTYPQTAVTSTIERLLYSLNHGLSAIIRVVTIADLADNSMLKEDRGMRCMNIRHNARFVYIVLYLQYLLISWNQALL